MVNIILISETLNSFPLIGIKEGCFLSPLLFKISNGIHSQCHRTRKKKLPLFIDVIIYTEDPMNFIKTR